MEILPNQEDACLSSLQRAEKPLFENLTNTSFEEEKNSMSNDFLNISGSNPSV
jgi:hypothetical protein